MLVVWRVGLGVGTTSGSLRSCACHEFLWVPVFRCLGPRVSCIADGVQRRPRVCVRVHPGNTGWGVPGLRRREANRPVTPDSGPRAQALWTKDGAAVVYPCHAVIVVLHVDTREQRFFLGHTDKVGTAGPSPGGLAPAG